MLSRLSPVLRTTLPRHQLAAIGQLSISRLPVHKAAAPSSFVQKRFVANPVSSQPGSSSLGHAARNVKEDIGAIAGEGSSFFPSYSLYLFALVMPSDHPSNLGIPFASCAPFFFPSYIKTAGKVIKGTSDKNTQEDSVNFVGIISHRLASSDLCLFGFFLTYFLLYPSRSTSPKI